MNCTKYIYRLVKPYQSNKVYEASTFMHGANKCYRELHKNNVKCNSFTILNINDNLIYEFNIKKKPQMILQEKNIHDNGYELSINNSKSTKLSKTNFVGIQELLNNTQIGGENVINNDIVKLKNQINLLEDRIKKLEKNLL